MANFSEWASMMLQNAALYSTIKEEDADLHAEDHGETE